MKAMVWVGLTGAALLLLFTIWLAWRNWTPEIYKPLVSILIGGLVALLVTLLTILRPSEEQRTFFSSVVFDERTNLPATLVYLTSLVPSDAASLRERITTRHFVLGQLASREPLHLQKDERKDALAAEYFQYKVLLDLREITGATDSKNIVVGPDEKGINRIYLLNRQRKFPPRAAQVSSEEVLQWLETNRISRLTTQIDHWRQRGLWLPRGARIKLSSQIVETVPERVITISYPGSFEASIRIQCLGSGGSGTLPPEINAAHVDIKHLSSYSIVVTMRAHFDWLSAASPEMPELKKWISFMFGKIEQFNSDYVVSRIGDHILDEDH